MKRIISYMGAALLALSAGCNRDIDIPYSPEAPQGLNSFSAMFATGEHRGNEQVVFTTLIDPTKEEVLISVPWFYPVESDNVPTIDKMRVLANIDIGCSISPGISGVYDLNRKHRFTFTNTNGVTTSHYFTGVVKKLDMKSVLEFNLQGAHADIAAIVDEEGKKISLLSPDPITGATVSATISPHATISPDPGVARDYTEPVRFTVTAHDGSTSVYTVQRGTPYKIPAGYRKGSEKQLWAHNLGFVLGVSPVAGANYSLGAIGNFVVLSLGREQVYFDVTTGARVGEIAGSRDLGAGSITSDKEGNLLMAAQADPGATFTLYTTDSPTTAPVELLSYTNASGGQMGKKISVQGNVKRNAIITVPVYTWAGNAKSFVRWDVINGTVSTPRFIIMDAVGPGWNGNGNGDVVYLTENAADGYFAAYYSDNTLYYLDGATDRAVDSFKAAGTAWDGNMNLCTVDAITFNNARYVATFTGRHFTWGAGYRPYLFEVTSMSNFNSGRALVYNPEQPSLAALGTYASSDVILWCSADGFKMRMFYTDSNCQALVAYEFDCVEK